MSMNLSEFECTSKQFVPRIKNVNPSTMPLIIVLMVNMRMTVCTTLGLERGLHLDNLPAQPNDHRA